MNKFLTFFTLPALLIACNPISDAKNILTLENKQTEIVGNETENEQVINTLRIPKISGTNFESILYKDLEILGAELAVIEAKEQVSLIAAGRELQTSASIQGGAKSITDKDSGAYGTLDVNKLLYDRGVLDLEIEAAEEKVNQSYLRYQQVAEAALIKAATAILKHETTAGVMNLSYLKLSMAEDIVKKIEKLNNAGQIDSTLLASAQQNIDRLKLVNREAEVAYRNAASELSSIFGVNALKVDADISVFERIASRKISSDNAIEIKALASELNSIELEIDALQASRWGSLSLRSQVDLPASTLDDKPDAMIGLMFSKTLGDGGRLEAQISALAVRAQQVQNTLDFRKTEIELELKTIDDTLDQLRSSRELREEMISNARERTSHLEDQLAIGMSTFSAVLEAHVSLFNLERENLEANGRIQQLELSKAALSGQVLKTLSLKSPLQL